jgi:hypothetical protein
MVLAKAARYRARQIGDDSKISETIKGSVSAFKLLPWVMCRPTLSILRAQGHNLRYF